MKVLGFAGSTSSESINKQLVAYVLGKFEGAETELLDLNDYQMPIFSVDLEKKTGAQQKAKDFVEKIGEADILVISLAEHNGSYSAAFKNTLDWATRIQGKVFQNKPTLLMASSGGGRGGMSVLEAAISRFPFLGADLKATFSFPFFNENFKPGEGIVNPELNAELNRKVAETLL